MLCEVTGLLALLTENNAPACAAIVSARVNDEAVNAENLPNGVQTLVDGILGLAPAFASVQETPRGDVMTARLHCVSCLVHFITSSEVSSDLAGIIESGMVPVTTGDRMPLLRAMVEMLIGNLSISDEVELYPGCGVH